MGRPEVKKQDKRKSIGVSLSPSERERAKRISGVDSLSGALRYLIKFAEKHKTWG